MALAARTGIAGDVHDLEALRGGEYVVTNASQTARDVHQLRVAVDRRIARLKLTPMGSRIDSLTPEQDRYLASWDMGT